MKRAREDEAESLVDQTVRAESSRAGAEKVNSVRQSSVAKDPGHSASDAGSSSHPWQAGEFSISFQSINLTGCSMGRE